MNDTRINAKEQRSKDAEDLIFFVLQKPFASLSVLCTFALIP
jgi:hypothetical protein